MASLNTGDEVRVFSRRRSQPAGGWPGEVVKVGRTLVTIACNGRAEQFRIDTGRINDDYGASWFRTMEQADLDARQARARAALSEHGVRLDHGHRLTLEQIEALAAVLADPESEG